MIQFMVPPDIFFLEAFSRVTVGAVVLVLFFDERNSGRRTSRKNLLMSSTMW